MQIITVPHPSLRKVAEPVTTVDQKLTQFIDELGKTLLHKRKPQGVGLAAPQVDKLWRAFVTRLPDPTQPQHSPVLRSFINPTITDAGSQQVLGVNPDEPDLEGCLSIPGLYGPVPRWNWVDVNYRVVEEGRLVEQQEHFTDFAARVMQHEIDHLDGILFTDHSLHYDLPVYRESDDGKRFIEIDRSYIELF